MEVSAHTRFLPKTFPLLHLFSHRNSSFAKRRCSCGKIFCVFGNANKILQIPHSQDGDGGCHQTTYLTEHSSGDNSGVWGSVRDQDERPWDSLVPTCVSTRLLELCTWGKAGSGLIWDPRGCSLRMEAARGGAGVPRFLAREHLGSFGGSVSSSTPRAVQLRLQLWHPGLGNRVRGTCQGCFPLGISKILPAPCEIADTGQSPSAGGKPWETQEAKENDAPLLSSWGIWPYRDVPRLVHGDAGTGCPVLPAGKDRGSLALCISWRRLRRARRNARGM